MPQSNALLCPPGPCIDTAPGLYTAYVPRVFRLVPKPAVPKLSILQISARSYAALLTGLLVIIAGCLVLTIGLYLFTTR